MKKNLIAIVATACILLVGCSKDPENGPVSIIVNQQAIAASAAYGKRMAEIEAEQRVKNKDKEDEDVKSKEKETRNTEAKKRMFHDISSGNILEALKKVAGSDVSRGTVTLSGVATNLTYNLLDNYGVRFSEDTHGVSSAFWLWAIENPEKFKVMMEKMKTPMRLNSEFITRLRETEGYLKRPFSAHEAEDIVLFCKPSFDANWDKSLESEACVGLNKKVIYVTPDVVHVAEFLLRRYNAGGKKMAEKFRIYGLELLNPR